jgi:ribosomal protein S27AE
LIELGAIAYFTRATFLATWDDRPYCEQCDCWNAEPEGLVNLPVSPSDPAWQRVPEVGPDAIRKLRLKENADEMVVLSVSACPQCDRSNYLSAAGGGWESNEKGEMVFQNIEILKYMAVTPRQIEDIKELGEMLEEAYQELSGGPREITQEPDGLQMSSDGPEMEPGRL